MLPYFCFGATVRLVYSFFFISFPLQKRSHSNSKWFVAMLGVLSRRIPRQVNKALWEISQLDPCELFALD